MKRITFLSAILFFCISLTKAQTMGNLWGMTTQRGDSNGGTMFGFDPITGNDSVIIPLSAVSGTYPQYGNNIIQAGGTLYGITYEGGANNLGTIYKRTASGNTTILHTFNSAGGDGYEPEGSIMMASDGMIYGMTSYGGANGYGTIFKCDTLGNYKVIHAFTSATTDGAYPQYGGLTQAANGTLWGMTESGGTLGDGVLFKCDTAGNLKVVYNFGTNPNDGTEPYGGIIFGTNGMMYGTTYGGGTGSSGIVFECDTLGNEKILHQFYSASDQYAYYPYGNLIQDSYGALYGMCYYGGGPGYGIIYKCDTSNNFKVVYSLGTNSNDGQYPYGSLIFGANDTLYGFTNEGGANGRGVLFKCDTTGTKESTMYSFGNYGNDAQYLYGTPLLSADGNIYGVSIDGGVMGDGTIFKYNLASATESVLYSFATNAIGNDGLSDFIQGKDGNLYGMTYIGGSFGSGTILKYDPVTGKTTILHTFYDTANNGASPSSGHLVQGSNGMLYGVTKFGGKYNLGVLFECTTSGTFKVIYTFGSVPDDATNPVGSLVIGKNGVLYGTGSAGGINSSSGAIFKCDTLGNEALVYSFGSSPTDASYPQAGFIMSARGTLYGMTPSGGVYGVGVIYKCDTAGNETVLHNFGVNPNDAASPNGSPVFGKDSLLFGTTNGGGTNGKGTIFKSDTTGTVTILYNFNYTLDAAHPMGSLIFGSDHYLYGTSSQGGTQNFGTIFKCDTLGNETVVYNFTGGSDGATPQMDLLEVMSLGTGTTVTCSGNVDTAMIRGGVPPFTYAWSNGKTVATDTLTTGTYTVSVTDARGITVNEIVNVIYTVVSVTAGNASICTGSSTNLSATGNGGTGGLTYTWMPGSLSGSSPSVNPTSPTTYTVMVTDTKGCKDSATETVKVNPLPTVTITGHDTINQGDVDTLTATGGVSYAWSDASTSNPDLVSPSANQGYTVTVTDTNGCVNTDSIMVVVNITTGIKPVASNSTSVYPNPATETMYLSFNLKGTATAAIQVMNAYGETVINTSSTISNGQVMPIDVSNLATSVYFVHITADKQTQVIRFIKQ